MSHVKDGLRRFDQWLADNGDIAALVLRQVLVPVEGRLRTRSVTRGSFKGLDRARTVVGGTHA